MANGTAVAEKAETVTKAPSMSDEQKKARMATLEGLLKEKVAKGEMMSPEAFGIMAEIAKLGKAKAPRAESDPAKVAEKDNLQKWKTENEKALGEQLNEACTEAFPILAQGGMKLEVVIRIKGVGRSASGTPSTGRANMAPRITHRKADGERFINLDSKAGPVGLNAQGLPSLKKLLEAYPDDAEKINAVLGTAELRKAAWNAAKDTKKKYVTLSDGSYLTLQS